MYDIQDVFLILKRNVLRSFFIVVFFASINIFVAIAIVIAAFITVILVVVAAGAVIIVVGAVVASIVWVEGNSLGC